MGSRSVVGENKQVRMQNRISGSSQDDMGSDQGSSWSRIRRCVKWEVQKTSG